VVVRGLLLASSTLINLPFPESRPIWRGLVFAMFTSIPANELPLV